VSTKLLAKGWERPVPTEFQASRRDVTDCVAAVQKKLIQLSIHDRLSGALVRIAAGIVLLLLTAEAVCVDLNALQRGTKPMKTISIIKVQKIALTRTLAAAYGCCPF
jgi:hypothetical protein